MTITLKQLQAINVQRGRQWHRAGLDNWSTTLAKHTGEACNAAKKLLRVEGEMANHDLRNPMVRKLASLRVANEYRTLVAKECADTILYAVLTMHAVGADAEDTIREVFNAKSEEYGFAERL